MNRVEHAMTTEIGEETFGFTDALELSLKIFDRLIVKKSLKDSCDANCPLIVQVKKLLLLAKEKRIEKMQNELGFSIP